jgi:hypothetical protein
VRKNADKTLLHPLPFFTLLSYSLVKTIAKLHDKEHKINIERNKQKNYETIE